MFSDSGSGFYIYLRNTLLCSAQAPCTEQEQRHDNRTETVGHRRTQHRVINLQTQTIPEESPAKPVRQLCHIDIPAAYIGRKKHNW